MRSMTGYGRASGDIGGRKITVEVRSVNGRNLDVRIRSMFEALALEALLETAVRKRFERGRIELRVSAGAGRAPRLKPNVNVAREAWKALQELREALQIAEAPSLDLVTRQAGVLEADGEDLNSQSAETLWVGLEPIVTAALDELVKARDLEGAALRADIVMRVATLRSVAQQLAQAAETRPDEARRELQARLARLDPPQTVDAARLAQEVALFAQRLDTTEERVRLDSHLQSLERLLGGGAAASGKQGAGQSGTTDSIGRKLDFMLQEVQREFSTTAAKAQSAEVSALCVTARAEVEKLREQAQNVE